MENRKLIIPIVLLGFLVNVSSALAYGVETHAFLTKEAVEFYNQHFENKISEENKIFLIDGARKEDDTPRYMNHFYDPVNNRGLTGEYSFGVDWLSSKLWSQSPMAQKAPIFLLGAGTEASILSASQIDRIKTTFSQTDFTWEKALRLYAENELEDALYALGHLIHLIEDAAVPDHTRNDPHPPVDDGGSPYENWTEKFTLENPDIELASRLTGKKPSILGDFNSYFDSMANYSNNNFYSKDSISMYKNPIPDYEAEIGKNIFVYKSDLSLGDYKVAVYRVKKDKYSYAQQNLENNLMVENDAVLQ